MRRLILCLAFAIGLATGPAAALEFKNAPDAALVAEVEAALLAYRAEFDRWPRDMDQLRRYAKKAGRTLDLSAFSEVTLRKESAQTVYVGYITAAPEAQEGGFAVTVIEIGPR